MPWSDWITDPAMRVSDGSTDEPIMFYGTPEIVSVAGIIPPHHLADDGGIAASYQYVQYQNGTWDQVFFPEFSGYGLFYLCPPWRWWLPVDHIEAFPTVQLTQTTRARLVPPARTRI